MYKILITTSNRVVGQSCAIHTLIVEFDARAKADTAIRIVNENKPDVYQTQSAIPLYL